MGLCIKCQHPIDLHENGSCTDIEGKINGFDIGCNCSQTKEDNKKQKDKVKKNK